MRRFLAALAIIGTIASGGGAQAAPSGSVQGQADEALAQIIAYNAEIQTASDQLTGLVSFCIEGANTALDMAARGASASEADGWYTVWSKQLDDNVERLRQLKTRIPVLPPAVVAAMSDSAQTRRYYQSAPSVMAARIDEAILLAMRVRGQVLKAAKGDSDAKVAISHTILDGSIANVESELNTLESQRATISDDNPNSALVLAMINNDKALIQIIKVFGVLMDNPDADLSAYLREGRAALTEMRAAVDAVPDLSRAYTAKLAATRYQPGFASIYDRRAALEETFIDEGEVHGSMAEVLEQVFVTLDREGNTEKVDTLLAEHERLGEQTRDIYLRRLQLLRP